MINSPSINLINNINNAENVIHMKISVGLLAFFALTISIQAQKFESSVFLDSYTKNEISLIVGISVNYAVDLYKVRYYTADIDGNDHIASGLLCVPQSNSLIFPLSCYQHGTVGDRTEVPSNLRGGFVLPMVFASDGYVVCAPDFLGLGDSPGIHPYVHAKTEASAGLDMLLAVRELDEQTADFDLNDQLFISGYSQGGHAAMALHREIETNNSDVFTVTASAPMSGPYSISDKMIDFTLGEEAYSTVAYLAWVMIAYKAVYPEILKDFELEDIFKEEFMPDILDFKNEKITLWELNDLITEILLTNVGIVRPKEMLKDGIEDAIKNDPNSPLYRVLADNDTYDWSPIAPTRIYYCVGDDQITFENAILADSVMNANGAVDLEAVRNDNFSLLTHSGCVLPASYSGILFFRNYRNILSSSEELAFDPNIKINNNNEQLIIHIPQENYRNNNRMEIIGMTGQVYYAGNIETGFSQHSIASLPSGMFLIRLVNQNKLLKSDRIVKY